MDRNAIIAALKQKAPELQARGVTHLAIYGSRARGDARPESDLDVLLEVDEKRKFSLIDLVGVERRIREAVGIVTFAVMRRSLKPDFAKRIAPDVVEVF